MHADRDHQHLPGGANNHDGSLPGSDPDGIDLRELLRKLNRRKGGMAAVFLLVMVAVLIFVFTATPRYTAQVQMVLELRQTKVVDLEAVLTGMPMDAAAIRSEIDILQSRNLLARVARKLQLDREPEFNPSLLESGNNPFYKPVLNWLEDLWLGSGDPSDPDQEEQEELLRRQIINYLARSLKIENPRQSYTIALSYTSTNPKQAAAIVNATAELYLTEQMEAKFEATRRANQWLAERLEDLRAEVNAAEMAVQELRERGNLVPARGATVLEQQIAEINAQMVLARVAKSQAEARLRGAQESLSRSGDAASLGDVLASPIIQNLRTEEAALRRKEAELSQRYGERHPEMIKIKAELGDIRKKMAEETYRVVESLANEVEVAASKEQTLRSSLADLRSQTSKTLQAEVELRELERQAQSARVIYENFLERFRETGEQDALLHRPDTRIISWALPPREPSFPRKSLTLGLGVAGGLMLSAMTAFLLEALDRGFRTGAQAEAMTGVPVLGMIPALPLNKGFPGEYILEKPVSPISESFRAIRTAIHLSNVDHPPRTVLITSALPDEGKSTLSVSLARLAALSGTKTLLIDADLRHTNKKFTLPDQGKAMLEDVLREAAELPEAIVAEKATGLNLLLCRGNTPGSADLLSSQRMAGLLRELSGRYDLVIIDTPPVMGVSDAWPLSRVVDAVVFAVRWSKTPRETVVSALNQMKMLGIRVSGLVLSRVDTRQHARYGHGGFGYYGKYRKYYQE